MKQLYLLLACLLLNTAAQASHYEPFLPGVLQQYALVGSDTTLAWQVDARGEFQEQLGKDRAAPCLLTRFANTPFGLRVGSVNAGTPQAEYYFEFQNTWQLWLRPGRPVGQPWPAYGSVTGQVTSRRLGTVLGQPDSLTTIALSSGYSLVLSQRHGLVSGPALLDVQQVRRRVRQFTLSALPGQGLGTPLLGARAVYDFQPGNVFCYHYSAMDLAAGPNPTSYDYGDSILTRQAIGNALVYSVWRANRGSSTGYRYTLTVADSLMPELLSSTGRYLPQQHLWVHELSPRAAMYNGQPVLLITDRHWSCFGDTAFVTPMSVDSEKYRRFGVGLGMVDDYEANMITPYHSTSLIGFQKGSVRWGTTFRLARPLATYAAQVGGLGTTASPNPFGQELTVRLELDRPQALALELRDALGRVVLSRPATPQPAGPATLRLATQALPAGLYTLRLLPAAAPAQVLKVLKN